MHFTDEQFLIIFEFVEGINLAQYIDEHGPCSLTQARLWFTQITSALQHAHSNGVVHRDIKPENIILASNLETAYLVDFGIAISADDGRRITESGFIIGTAGYMAPEQAEGEIVDHQADIYSLGVTLYEALSGHPIAVGAYKELSAANEAIPVEIDVLIQDCLQPKDRRLTSVREFGQRLSGTLRLRRPLSIVLAQGRLHEFAFALEELSPEGLATLPSGQKALIITKILSVVESDDESLIFPGAELLELMLTRGLLLEPEEYRKIVKPSIRWAYEKTYPGGTKGRRTLQDTLDEACLAARGDAHQVLREEMESFLEEVSLAEKEDWYLHATRMVVSSLLANPSFTGDASKMSNYLDEINREQRSRVSSK